MKYVVGTLSNRNYDPVFSITNPVKQEYCDRHGYQFVFRPGEFPYSTVFYDRWRWFLELMKATADPTWFLFCGVDVLLTNLTLPLEDIVLKHATDDNTEIIMARDALMFNTDVFLIRNSEIGKLFAHEVLDEEPKFLDREKDQCAVEHLCKTFKIWKHSLKVVPQRVLQGYEYALYKDLGGNYAKSLDADGNDGQWQPGDFALHVPAHMERKAQILKEHIPLIVR